VVFKELRGIHHTSINVFSFYMSVFCFLRFFSEFCCHLSFYLGGGRHEYYQPYLIHQRQKKSNTLIIEQSWAPARNIRDDGPPLICFPASPQFFSFYIWICFPLLIWFECLKLRPSLYSTPILSSVDLGYKISIPRVAFRTPPTAPNNEPYAPETINRRRSRSNSR